MLLLSINIMIHFDDSEICHKNVFYTIKVDFSYQNIYI